MIWDRLLPQKYKVLKSCDRMIRQTAGFEKVAANAKLLKTESGRCFIIGNGPSLKNEKTEKLRGEITFTVNDMYLSPLFPSIQTNYHLFFDPQYKNRIDEIMEKIHQSGADPVLVTNLDFRDSFSNTKSETVFLKSGFDIDHLKYYGLHIDKLLPYFCTVVQYALAMAIELGFREIYLLGCDSTSIINYIERKKGEAASQYSFEISKEEEKKLSNVSEMTAEHAFYEWHHIFKSYRILNEIAKERGIQITDLTSDGILDVFEKKRLDDIL